MMHQYILDHPDYILGQRTHHHILGEMMHQYILDHPDYILGQRSPGGAPNTDTLEISNDGYLAPSNIRYFIIYWFLLIIYWASEPIIIYLGR
jgi:hypothetical protein